MFIKIFFITNIISFFHVEHLHIFSEKQMPLTKQNQKLLKLCLPHRNVSCIVSKDVCIFAHYCNASCSQVVVKIFSIYQTWYLYLQVNIFTMAGQLMQQCNLWGICLVYQGEQTKSLLLCQYVNLGVTDLPYTNVKKTKLCLVCPVSQI